MQLKPFSLSPTVSASPDMADTSVFTVDASLVPDVAGFLLEHRISGPGMATLALPPPAVKPARRDELWKHTCVEAFFAVADSRRYYEFNGSPSGDWALYQFEDYRQGMQSPPVKTAPRLLIREKQRDTLRLVWHVPFFCGEVLERAGITTILRTAPDPGQFSYWALTHAGSRPDFHLRESFSLALPPHDTP